MDVLILVILYGLEALKYMLVYDLLLDRRLQKSWIFLAGGVLCLGVTFVGRDWNIHFLRSLLLTAAMIITFFLMKEKFSQRIFYYLTMLFFVSCMGGIATGIWGRLAGNLEIMKTDSNEKLLLEGIIEIVFLVILSVIKRLWKRYHTGKQGFFKRNMQYIVLSLSVFMIAVISLLRYIKPNLENHRLANFIDVIVIGAYGGIMVLGLFAIYIKDSNERLERELETEKEFAKLQELHYENLLERELETRKYRHDIKNHLLCLNQLAAGNEMDKVKEYIEELRGDLEEAAGRLVWSGNDVIDILTNYYARLMGRDCPIEVEGKLCRELSVSDVQLCTIYGNLISNAVEAQGMLPQEKRKIIIRLKEGQEHVRIRIENPLEEYPEKDIGGEWRSRKTDSQNHGFGLENVKRVVEAVEGSLELGIKEGWFYAAVTLKR